MFKEIGQLIITGIGGTVLTDEEIQFIEEENIGGVLLFAHNYESPAQLAELVNSIQKLRDEWPLFICVDHEGGRVIRFKKNFSQFPAMLDIAKLGSPKICYTVAQIMSKELAACGVNVNFAPCCDILTNPLNQVIGDRALGHDPEEVSKYVSSVIRGLQTNKILACAKHFPGHGDTKKDSHYDLPLIKKSLKEIREVELLPFIKAVKSRVEFVMMAHLQVDAIDPDFPCTLSPKAYKLLREELKFTKLIVTDDMEMGAITKKYSTEVAAVKAIGAGADLLEYRSLKEAKKALYSLKEAMKIKELKNEDIRKKLDRVLAVKKNHLSDYKPIYIPEITKTINDKNSQLFLEDIIQKIKKAKESI